MIMKFDYCIFFLFLYLISGGQNETSPVIFAICYNKVIKTLLYF